MADRGRDFFKVDIEGLRPLRGARTAEFTATAPRGLSLRASLNRDGSVTRAWQSRYTKPGGGAGRLVYGHHPSMTVEDAVAAHKAARALLDAGLDPATARVEEQRRLDGRISVADAFKQYVADQTGTLAPRTIAEYERMFNVNIIDSLGATALADVTPAMIKDLLRAEWRAYDAREKERVALAKTNGRERKARSGTLIRKIHNGLGSFFTWAASAKVELIEASPVPNRKVMGYASKTPDPRPLGLDELKPFWAGVEASSVTGRTKAALKLLLLTGARANEILNIQRKDVHFNGKIIDARGDEEREIGVGYVELRVTKNSKPRLVPLTDTSRAILNDLLRVTGSEPSSYLFPNKKDASRPMLVSSLDHAVSRNITEFNLQAEGREFTPHCLRATTSTLIQQRGFSEATAGLVLGHAKKSVTGRHYTKYEAMPEKFDALRAVERTLMRAIGADEQAPTKAVAHV